MTGRPHSERMLHDLEEIRTELAGEVSRIQPGEFEWAPRPDMKSFRALLLEIGAMEKVCIHWLIHQSMFDWKEAEAAIASAQSGSQEVLEGLGRVREETLGYLRNSSEEALQTPLAVPAEWEIYFGKSLEPEEMVRWIARHEYYHLGQIISYRWILGDNPYKRDG